MPVERQQAWYVKASFGAEWGPMSAETLLEMADSGSLARDDLARCGVESNWQPVPKILDQLRSPPTSDTKSNVADEQSESEPSEDDGSLTLATVEDPAIETPVPLLRPSAPKKSRAGALPGWSNYWAPESSTSQQSTAASRRVVTDFVPVGELATSGVSDERTVEGSSNPQTTVAPDSDPVPADSSDSESDGPFAALDAWKQKRKEQLDRLLKIVADREAAAVRAAEAAKATEAQAAQNANATDSATAENTGKAATAESATSSSPSKSETAPAADTAPPKTALREEPWDETLSRWKRSLPDWRVAILLVILPLVVWWCWPVSQRNIADTFHSMYAELRTRRDLPQDKTGMNEFVERSQTKLDEMLPGLEKRATPQDPDSQLLFWIARDCLRPLLKSPRSRNTKHEDTLKKLLAQWDETHHITRDVKLPESPAAELPRVPSSSTSALGFGTSPDSGDPSVEMELPAPPRSSKSQPHRTEDDDQN